MIDTMLGPVYVAHPYSGNPGKNVNDARRISSLLNHAGIATVSPLQESYRREHALSEEQWLCHGLTQLRACAAMVVPEGIWLNSHGCRVDVDYAFGWGIPVFWIDKAVPEELLAYLRGEGLPAEEGDES